MSSISVVVVVDVSSGIKPSINVNKETIANGTNDTYFKLLLVEQNKTRQNNATIQATNSTIVPVPMSAITKSLLFLNNSEYVLVIQTIIICDNMNC